MSFTYINGNPIVVGNARVGSLGLGNLNKQMQIRLSTNPNVTDVNRAIFPALANVYLGQRSTLPANGAGSPVNDSAADIADRTLNSSEAPGVASGQHDLRRYRGLGLSSGAYNDPYNKDLGYGSYAYSVQYPDGGPVPANGPLPYPLSGPYSTPDYNLYGYDQQWKRINNVGQLIIAPDAERGFNIDINRGGDCKYITGLMPDASRGFHVDPCTGYNNQSVRGCLANSSGGNIKRPFEGLDFNPCTRCPLGRNPCGNTGTPYGVANPCTSTPYQNIPYGLSSCNQPFNTPFRSVNGLEANARFRNSYLSPFAYPAANGCQSCR